MSQFQQNPQPEANKQPVELVNHGNKRIDNYFWMNKRDSKEVLDYIQQENNYSASYFKTIDGLTNELLDEFEQRIDPNDISAPFKMNGKTFQYRNIEGKDYREIIEINPTGNAVFFDENERAKGHEYYSLGDFSNSNNNELLAFSEDIIGRRNYTIRIRINASNKLLKDEVKNTDGSVVWASDNKTFFYVRKDETTLREFQVYRHVLGTKASEDELIFEEKDERFAVYINKSFDDRYVLINTTSTTTSEVLFIDANQPQNKPQLFLARLQDHLYQIDHHENGFYVISNYKSPNNQLVFTKTTPSSITDCEVIIPHQSNTYIDAFIAYQSFLVIQQRTNGQTNFLYGQLNGKDLKSVTFKESVYEISFKGNDDYKAQSFEYYYSSLTRPASVFEFDVPSSTSKLLFEKKLRDPLFQPENYVSERVWAVANDGTKIPISLVHKKGIDLKKAPLLLYGYGSYGVTIPASFSATRLSLLDRGFVYAIAHIRGGKFMGEEWYQSGKLNKKRHSFTDFINCAEWLSMKGYCDPNNIFAQGGSAGGLLMGAVANMAPQRFKGIIAQVPFVDVVTTMLDESIPLTVGEYEEWGNPNKDDSYWYMLSYSPYDNVQAMDYPAMLITTGYHDSQVQYWEPLKWVAKLRDYNTGNAPILFDCTMSAGHGGGSGRTTERMEVAKEFAFLLSLYAK
ncbi:MAG: S9 family peptidase [Fluviicola sp.]|nr:S9 family peptidase [Fluviicola sp.]